MIQNIPYMSLGWITLGFIILVIGIVKLASLRDQEEAYVQYTDNNELFSFFLQEEEKKNEELRETIKVQGSHSNPNTYENQKNNGNEAEKSNKGQGVQSIQEKQENTYNDILALYKNGKSIEAIAKQMKMGVGEVKLIISLTAMR